jgi:hypothetical protein
MFIRFQWNITLAEIRSRQLSVTVKNNRFILGPDKKFIGQVRLELIRL